MVCFASLTLARFGWVILGVQLWVANVEECSSTPRRQLNFPWGVRTNVHLPMSKAIDLPLRERVVAAIGLLEERDSDPAEQARAVIPDWIKVDQACISSSKGALTSVVQLWWHAHSGSAGSGMANSVPLKTQHGRVLDERLRVGGTCSRSFSG